MKSFFLLGILIAGVLFFSGCDAMTMLTEQQFKDKTKPTVNAALLTVPNGSYTYFSLTSGQEMWLYFNGTPKTYNFNFTINSGGPYYSVYRENLTNLYLSQKNNSFNNFTTVASEKVYIKVTCTSNSYFGICIN